MSSRSSRSPGRSRPVRIRTRSSVAARERTVPPIDLKSDISHSMFQESANRKGNTMGAAAKRQMSLVGFMQAGNTSVYAGSWRHPATEHGFLTASYYQKLGQTLEDGCFDLMFFDDRLAMPGIYGGFGAATGGGRAPPVEPGPGGVAGGGSRGAGRS